MVIEFRDPLMPQRRLPPRPPGRNETFNPDDHQRRSKITPHQSADLRRPCTTIPTDFSVPRHSRAGGIIHEYQQVAWVFGTLRLLQAWSGSHPSEEPPEVEDAVNDLAVDLDRRGGAR